VPDVHRCTDRESRRNLDCYRRRDRAETAGLVEIHRCVPGERYTLARGCRDSIIEVEVSREIVFTLVVYSDRYVAVDSRYHERICKTQIVQIEVVIVMRGVDLVVVTSGEGLVYPVIGTDYRQFRPLDLDQTRWIPRRRGSIVGRRYKRIGHTGSARAGTYRTGRNGHLEFLRNSPAFKAKHHRNGNRRFTYGPG